MNQLSFLIQTQTAWFCASWQQTMQTMWHCRSTSPCCSPSVATAASQSCESRGFSGSSSCFVPWMPTGTRKNTETSTACWLRTRRPTTAGYKRWGPTARRVDALTNGCLNLSCRNAEGSGTHTHEQKQELSGFRYWNHCCSCRDGLEWTGTGCPDKQGPGTPFQRLMEQWE